MLYIIEVDRGDGSGVCKCTHIHTWVLSGKTTIVSLFPEKQVSECSCHNKTANLKNTLDLCLISNIGGTPQLCFISPLGRYHILFSLDLSRETQSN